MPLHLSFLLGKRAVEPKVVRLCFSLWPVVFQVIVAISITACPACKLPRIGADGNSHVADVSLVLHLIVEGLLLVHVRLQVLYALVDVGLEVKVLAVAFIVIASTGSFGAM